MKKRHTEEQIVKILEEVKTGLKVEELCRKHGISPATYYSWKSKYGGMTISDVKRLKALELENGRLKKLVADLSLDNAILKDINQGKW